MVEITRVPLQPITRGSLTKLWAAIALAVLAAIAIAWASVPAGVRVEVVNAGEGSSPGPTDVVFVTYTGRLADGTVFDQSQPLPIPVEGILPEGTPLPLENMLPGFSEALMRMQRGGTYEAYIPAAKAYGDTPPPGAPIPPGADLSFTIELIDFMPREEFEGRIQLLQQMMSRPAPPDPGTVDPGGEGPLGPGE